MKLQQYEYAVNVREPNEREGREEYIDITWIAANHTTVS